jgi:hypothetical protein
MPLNRILPQEFWILNGIRGAVLIALCFSQSENAIISNTMTPNVETPPARPNRVQAWVYAILNPLIESLRREIELLRRGNLSWRFYSGKCEYIRRIFEYIGPDQQPNFEDFLADRLNEGFASHFDAHDSNLSVLEGSASAFFKGLMQSNLFLKEVQDSLEEYKARAEGKPLYPAADPIERDLPKYVAEYLINRTELLPSHYLTHKFWEEFRSRFEASATEFEPYRQRESFQRLKQSVVTLHNVSQGLLAGLEQHRYGLCSTYDIPAAPLPTNLTHSVDAYIRNR